MKKPEFEQKRRLVQVISALATNPFLANIWKGRIYKGTGKLLCAPGLNCYSCPAAVTSCPIGALQTVGGSNRFSLSFYILGFLLVVGTLIGRAVCGFLCVFGLLQDLLYKIPMPKITLPKGLDQKLRYLKYVILVLLVLLLPAVITDEFGLGDPFFCEYICPAGTIQGGIPLLLTSPSLRQMAGSLFLWKACLAAGILILSTMIYRPFCRYLCPLGAFYGLFNRFSFLGLQLEKSACTDCGACEKACPMAVNIRKNINGLECIRCGKCRTSCKAKAIRWKFYLPHQ